MLRLTGYPITAGKGSVILPDDALSDRARQEIQAGESGPPAESAWIFASTQEPVAGQFALAEADTAELEKLECIAPCGEDYSLGQMPQGMGWTALCWVLKGVCGAITTGMSAARKWMI